METRSWYTPSFVGIFCMLCSLCCHAIISLLFSPTAVLSYSTITYDSVSYNCATIVLTTVGEHGGYHIYLTLLTAARNSSTVNWPNHCPRLTKRFFVHQDLFYCHLALIRWSTWCLISIDICLGVFFKILPKYSNFRRFIVLLISVLLHPFQYLFIC